MARRLNFRPLKELEEELEFTDRVGKMLASAGYRVTRLSRVGGAPSFDFVARSPDDKRVAVECRARGLKDDRAVMEWIAIGEQLNPKPDALWVVSDDITERLRRMTDAYQDVELWTFYELQRQMEWRRQKTPLKKQKTKIKASVKANSGQIIIAAAALAALIDDKLEALKAQKPNSSEGIDALNGQISDYEALKARVDELQDAVSKFTKNKIKEATLTKKAVSFGDGVSNWWSKDHAKILSTSYGMGVFLSAVGVCSLIGVNLDIATVTAGALMGGKSVAAAVKALPKTP